MSGRVGQLALQGPALGHILKDQYGPGQRPGIAEDRRGGGPDIALWSIERAEHTVVIDADLG